MAAIGIGFSALYLAVVLWVYFDAIEHERAAIAWALATLSLAWFFGLPLILYAIMKDRDRTEIAPGSGQREYLYVASLTGLVVAAVGLALVSGALLLEALRDESDFFGDGYKEAVASGIVSALVGLAVWLIPWRQAEGRLLALDDREFYATFRIHRAYLYTVLGLFWISTIIVSLWFLGGMVSDLLGTDVTGSQWAPAFGPLIVGAAVIAIHQFGFSDSTTFRAATARFAALSSSPAVMASDAASVRAVTTAEASRFCSACGNALRAGERFCPSCGTQVN